MNFRLHSDGDWKRVVGYVRSLPFVRKVDGVERGVFYRLSIEELKPSRTHEQNSRYWALVTAISQQAPAHMGGEYHAPEVWHEYLARRFLGMVPGPFGEGVRKSTSKLKVGEFSDYMTEIEAWAHDEFAGFDFTWQAAA